MTKRRKCRWEDVKPGEVWIDSTGDVFFKINMITKGVWLQNLTLYKPLLDGEVVGDIALLGDALKDKFYIPF